MINTINLYKDRIYEIEFYFNIIINIESTNIDINEKGLFVRILKSNFILMLYNFVEACVVSGILEIYENMNSNNCTYKSLIEEIKIIWSKYRIGQIYKNNGKRNAYEKTVYEMLNHITSDMSITLSKQVLDINGNLDAKKIKELCDKHRIRYRASDRDRCLYTVKNKRNMLAHGDESFGNCARDMTFEDLKHIKDEVISFINSIVIGMQDYYDNKSYLKK